MCTKTIRILFVEDNPGDVRLVEEMLVEANANTSLDWTFHFEHAERLDQAVDKILKNSVDVLLLDLMLPDSSGLETVTKMLSVSSAPIIVMSGHDNENLAFQAVQAGAQDYLVKGRIDSHGLERAVRYAVERKRIEVKLRESEEKYRLVTENIPVVVYSALPNADSTNVFVSGRVKELTGYTGEEMLSDPKLWNRLIHPDDRPNVWAAVKRHRAAKTLLDVEYRINTKDGRTLWIHDMAVPMLDEKGNITRINGFMEDITERKQTEDALRQSEERFRLITENNMDLLAQMTPDGRYLYVSPSYKTILGYGPEELLGKNIDRFVHPKDIKCLIGTIRQTAERRQELSRVEYRIFNQNGQYRWLEALIKLLYQPGGELIKVQLHSRDITDRKEMEERLQISIHEKNVLLKEIHHRVKNNMQVIMSLLNLQSDQIKDRSLYALFKESQNRIFSMALVHEMLYKSEDLSKIDFKEYLKKLIETLFDSYGANQRGIGHDLDLESIVLDIDKAIPCGLIVQEIISNSLKYAFPPEWKGKSNVRVGLHRKEGNAHLTIGDNGIGIPEKINTKLPKSLGLNLVSILAEQLQAKIKLDKNEGTEFRIVFRVSK